VIAAAPRFRLDPHLPAASALRRAALGQLDHALASVARDTPRGIHEARKACKRLRSLLRLMRPALGDTYRTQNLRLRDAGRALSARRDAAVLRATARSIGVGMPSGMPPQRDGGATAARAVKLLQAQRRAVGRWAPDALTREALDEALVEGYRRARRAGARARRHPRAELLHEWRKQVKHHRFQCEAVASARPQLLPRAHALDDLGEILGRHHDLELLAGELQRHPQRFDGPASVLRAVRRVRGEQERVAARALRSGTKLFGPNPRKWFEREVAR